MSCGKHTAIKKHSPLHELFNGKKTYYKYQNTYTCNKR
ncbi:unknown [Paraprevotella clara CAG:116]|nr:unknown [Paraprevotella clara CAG:116]